MRTRLLLPAAVLVLFVQGCITVPEEGSLPPRAPANMEEASRLNTDLAIDYVRRGNYDLATEKLTRALDQNPNNALAHSTIAFVLVKQGEAAEADQHFKYSLQLLNDPSTRNNYGVFLCGEKRFAEAEKMFLAAATDPAYKTPEAAWTNAGQCARRIPDLPKAEGFFRTALQLKPGYAEALAQMAWVSYANKDYLRARAFVQRYEKVGPATPETLWIAARTEEALGDTEASAGYETRLHTEFPEADEKSLAPHGTPSS